jgi:hypothetical protein
MERAGRLGGAGIRGCGVAWVLVCGWVGRGLRERLCFCREPLGGMDGLCAKWGVLVVCGG